MSTPEPQPADSENTQSTDALTTEVPTTELPAQGDAETVRLWATATPDAAPSETAAEASAPSVPAALPRRRVRVGTIVWGGVLLVIAGLARIATLIDPSAYTPTFVIWSVIGFGGLLVIAGLVGAVVKAVTSRPTAGTTR